MVMVHTPGLDVERLIWKAREAGRLYEQAKQESDASAGSARAAEQRAEELCKHIADSILAEQTLEAEADSKTKQPARSCAATTPAAANNLATASGAPSRSCSLNYDRFERIAAAALEEEEDDISRSILQGGVANQVQQTQRASGNQYDHQPAPPELVEGGSRLPNASPLDYARFDRAVTAALVDDSEEQDGKAADLHTRRIAHRLAGVVEDVRKIGPGSAAGTTAVSAAAKASKVGTQACKSAQAEPQRPLKDVAARKEMYSSDYSRFARLLAAQDENEENELSADGVFTNKTHKILGELEAQLAQLHEAADADEADAGAVRANERRLFRRLQGGTVKDTNSCGVCPEECLDEMD